MLPKQIDSERLTKGLCKLRNKILDTRKWPTNWVELGVCNSKSHENSNCEEHRTMAVISHTSERLLLIQLNRMKNSAEQELENVQMFDQE